MTQFVISVICKELVYFIAVCMLSIRRSIRMMYTLCDLVTCIANSPER